MKITPEVVAQCEALAAVLSIEQIAAYFGIHRTTFYDKLKGHPDLAAAVERGKSKALAGVATALLTKARNGDNACMMFYLKTQGGWRETTRLEVDDVTDKPDLSRLTEQERTEYLRLVVKGQIK
jgi:hypothetical protein